MVDKRSLRSSKPDQPSSSAPSTNGDNGKAAASNKSAPTRTASTRAKSTTAKKGPIAASDKDAADDTTNNNGHHRSNGVDPIENGVNGSSDDVEMGDEASDAVDKSKSNSIPGKKDKDGDDEMTVVVPPPNSSKLVGRNGPDDGDDVVMEGVEKTVPTTEEEEEKVDPVAKAVAGMSVFVDPTEFILEDRVPRVSIVSASSASSITDGCDALDIKGNYTLLERAVALFDARFSLRVLRSISSIRKRLSPEILAQVITETYPSSDPTAHSLLETIGKEGAAFEKVQPPTEMEVDGDNVNVKPQTLAPSNRATTPREVLPEVDIYLAILVQVHLLDTKAMESGAAFSSKLVQKIHTLNRRTLDSLSARVYFYYSFFHEQLAPLPPSPMSPVVQIRQQLLAALRTAVLRKDTDTQATVTTLLLRNYLSTSHIPQADLLVSHTQFPAAASNNQIARYLYYLGRIRAIQLSYTEAQEHLTGATRKSPSSASAAGFFQASTKLLIVVELLMGDIPDRAVFRQPSLERALQPYLLLVQGVRVGDLESFLNTVHTHSATFRRDGTYTLILRLRQNVIKTGIRMMSLSYSRISLRDICVRLSLDSEESAEYIVAKAIRDGVIEATLDHERGFMKSKDPGDIYATREPGEAFHDRIRACLGLHDESVKVRRMTCYLR